MQVFCIIWKRKDKASSYELKVSMTMVQGAQLFQQKYHLFLDYNPFMSHLELDLILLRQELQRQGE